MIKYVLAWIPMLVIAVANGAFRELTLAKRMSEPRAHRLSTLIGSVLTGIFIWFFVFRCPPSTGQQALLVGILWLVLTVTFEFFMGLVLMHQTLAETLEQYNVFQGRVWVFFLLWITLAPWLFLRFQNQV